MKIFKDNALVYLPQLNEVGYEDCKEIPAGSDLNTAEYTVVGSYYINKDS